MKVLITLRFLGFGYYQRVTGQGFNIPVSQATYFHQAQNEKPLKMGKSLTSEFRCFTSYEAESSYTYHDFCFRGHVGFLGVLGCIDCTHVGIVTPHVNEDGYKNHYGYYSLNVQMVCDDRLRIININPNFPGSVHDQFIFNASLLKQEMREISYR